MKSKKDYDKLSTDISQKSIQNSDTDANASSSPNYQEDEADDVFDRKERKHKVNTIIRRIVLVIAIIVFCYAAFMLVKIFLEYKKGNDIYNNIQQDVLNEDPTTLDINDSEVEVPFVYDHQALLSINPEGLGYIYIPSIDIRLPIAQTTDNDYYLTHTFNRSSNSNGCLFEDYRIKNGLKSSNVIIYGHNMNNGSMFGQLYKYKSYYFWNTEGNDVFYIYTENKIMEYKIFSVYISEPISSTYEFNFPTLESTREYAQEMKNQSMYDTGVDVSNTTQVITLSTCTENGEKRLIVHGTYVGEASLDNR